MKRYKIIESTIILFLVIIIFPACRKDKGNYNYKDLPGFYFEGRGGSDGGTITITQGTEELFIDPRVIYLGESEIDYCWTMYYVSPDPLSIIYPNDTISREPVLRTLVNRPVGTSLRLLFSATEKSTGLIIYRSYNISISAGIPTGWMVAYEKNGQTDVDLIRHSKFITNAKDTIYRNLYETANGNRVPGTPIALGSGVRSINYILTSSGGATVRYTNFERVSDYADVIGHLNPGLYKPEGLFWFQSTTNVLFNNGTVYSYDNSAAVRMSARASSSDQKGYIAAPFNAVAGVNAAVFYDQLNLRMMYVSYLDLMAANSFPRANPEARFTLDSIGKQLLYLGNGFGSVNGGSLVYAFFKDIDNNNKRYLYVMASQRPAQPDVAMIDISGAPEILNARFYALGFLGPVTYYATESKVFLMQVNASGNTVVSTAQPSFTAPSGEAITAIKLYNNTTMFIATWNETLQQGKLYMMAVDGNTGVINAEPVKVYDQFGKIGAMEFKRY